LRIADLHRARCSDISSNIWDNRLPSDTQSARSTVQLFQRATLMRVFIIVSGRLRLSPPAAAICFSRIISAKKYSSASVLVTANAETPGKVKCRMNARNRYADTPVCTLRRALCRARSFLRKCECGVSRIAEKFHFAARPLPGKYYRTFPPWDITCGRPISASLFLSLSLSLSLRRDSEKYFFPPGR